MSEKKKDNKVSRREALKRLAKGVGVGTAVVAAGSLATTSCEPPDYTNTYTNYYVVYTNYYY